MLRGTVNQIVGLTYLVAVEVQVIAQGQSIPSPVVVQGLEEALEGRHVQMEGLTMVDPDAWQTNPTASYDFLFLSQDGDTILLQIAMGMPLWGGSLPGNGLREYSISGVVRQFDLNSPLLDGHYLLPRYGTDFEEMVSSTKEISDFDLSVVRFGESLRIETPSAIASVKLVSLNGQVLQTNTFQAGQTLINVEVASSTTPLQVLWVQLTDGRNKAVFVH